MPSPSRRWIAFLVVAAGLLAFLLIWLTRRAGQAPVAAAPTETYRPLGGALPPTVAGNLAGGQIPEDPQPATVELLKKTLADYRAVTVYPPWSRVIDASTRPKLTWNQPVIADLPMDNTPGSETIFHFGADRFQVPYGEAITTWIEVVHKSDGTRVPATISDGWLMSVDGGRVAQVGYHDDGLDGDEVAGDLRYSNRLVPSSYPKLQSKAQQVFIRAVLASGSASQPVMRDFLYAPRKAIEIVGVARDDLKNGSLAVAVNAKVGEKGLYTFEANLLSADGNTPIVYGEVNANLDSGDTTVELTFFGRAFREKGVDGPYLLRDLRVFRRFVTENEQNFYSVYAGTYLTRAYRHDQFSNAEWDAPEKRETIGHFDRLIAQAESGTTPPGQAGKPTLEPVADPPLPANPPIKR